MTLPGPLPLPHPHIPSTKQSSWLQLQNSPALLPEPGPAVPRLTDDCKSPLTGCPPRPLRDPGSTGQPQRAFCYCFVLSVCGVLFPFCFFCSLKSSFVNFLIAISKHTQNKGAHNIPRPQPSPGQSCCNHTLTHCCPLPTLFCSKSLTTEGLSKQIRSSHFLVSKPPPASQALCRDSLHSPWHPEAR